MVKEEGNILFSRARLLWSVADNASRLLMHCVLHKGAKSNIALHCMDPPSGNEVSHLAGDYFPALVLLLLGGR